MTSQSGSVGRREQAKEDKRRRITEAARALFAEHGVGGVTTQQIADRADVAIGTLFLYASTKAELLIMVQNHGFAAAIDHGLIAARDTGRAGERTVETVLALVEPVVACIREQPENGRTYLGELVFGDPSEPHRREGLALSLRLEDAITGILADDAIIDHVEAATLARVLTSIIYATATVPLHQATADFLPHIRQHVAAALACRLIAAPL
jgi:AcrR family transcriptional regulator